MPSLLFLAATGLAFYAVFKLASFVRSYMVAYREYMKLEGEPHSWLWGHLRPHQVTFPMDDSSIDFFSRCARKFNWRPFRMMIGPFKHFTVLTHPDDIGALIKTAEPKNADVYSPFRLWLGNGLVIATGQLWSRNRRLLTPAFHFTTLKSYMGIFDSSINTAVEVLAQSAKSGQPVEVVGCMSRMTLDILLQCTMSYKSNCQIDRGARMPYIDAVVRATSLIVERVLSIPHQSDLIYSLSSNGREYRRVCNFLHTYSEEIVKNRRKALNLKTENNVARNGETEATKCRDFIDILLQAKDSNGVGMTDVEIRQEVDVFMIGGHDTTANGLSWSLYCLAKYPEHQAKIRDEVKRVWGDGKGKAEVTWDSLNLLTYTTQCIREGIRLYPPSYSILRDLTEDLKIRHNVLPKGQSVMMSIITVHRNPEFWEDPDEFKPERMSAEASKNRHPYAFIPFSAGPRNCIGKVFALAELRLAIAQIISNYQVELVEDHEPKRLISIVMRPKGNLMLKFKFLK